MSDVQHRKLVKQIIQETRAKQLEGHKYKYDCEVPYNNFGNRGFVDLIIESRTIVQDEFTSEYFAIIEAKPVLDDLGHTIRQLRGARAAYKKGLMVLAVYLTKHNLDFIEENFEILATLNDFMIWTYLENGDRSISIVPKGIYDIATKNFREWWQYPKLEELLDHQNKEV